MKKIASRPKDTKVQPVRVMVMRNGKCRMVNAEDVDFLNQEVPAAA
jgi:hypothetical protein